MAFTYKDLDAWRLSMQLVEAVYRATQEYPRSELYGLTGQTRRAAVSIPSNIAEGHCRRSTNAYSNHVSIALGSHGELCTLLELGRQLGFLPEGPRGELLALTDSVGRLLYGLHSALERRGGRR